MFRYIHGGDLAIGTRICNQEAPIGAVMTLDLSDSTQIACSSGGEKRVYFLTQEVTTEGRSYIDKAHGIPNIVGLDAARKAWFAKVGDRVTIQGGPGIIYTTVVHTALATATVGDEIEAYYDATAGYSKLQKKASGTAIGRLIQKNVDAVSGLYEIEIY